MPDAASLLMPLKELLNDDAFVSQVEDTARSLPRLFYQNSVLTIDTHVYFLWGTVALAVLLALAYLIFGDWSKLDILGSLVPIGGGSGYGQAYKSEDMLNELQNQVSDLQTRLVSDPSGGDNNYNSFDYAAAGYTS